MNKICTSLEQSKKLMELGLDINTADMFYLNDGISAKLMWEHLPNVKKETVAWSLSALLGLFDDKAGIAKDYGTWFAYDNGKSHCTKHYNEMIDAAFEMVVWLKENGKI